MVGSVEAYAPDHAASSSADPLPRSTRNRGDLHGARALAIAVCNIRYNYHRPHTAAGKPSSSLTPPRERHQRHGQQHLARCSPCCTRQTTPVGVSLQEPPVGVRLLGTLHASRHPAASPSAYTFVTRLGRERSLWTAV